MFSLGIVYLRPGSCLLLVWPVFTIGSGIAHLAWVCVRLAWVLFTCESGPVYFWIGSDHAYSLRVSSWCIGLGHDWILLVPS